MAVIPAVAARSALAKASSRSSTEVVDCVPGKQSKSLLREPVGMAHRPSAIPQWSNVVETARRWIELEWPQAARAAVFHIVPDSHFSPLAKLLQWVRKAVLGEYRRQRQGRAESRRS
jgi:hypothetical protein